MGIVALVILFMIALFVGQGLFGSLISLLIAMFFWMLAGNVAGHIIRGEDYGVAGNIALGLLGGIVGSILLRWLGLGGVAGIPLFGGIITGIFGAIVVVYLMRWTIDRNFGK